MTTESAGTPLSDSSPDAPDPFTLEVIKHFLMAIGDEMFVAQQRTSMSPLIYEVLDFAAGVTDADGETITQGNGVTFFIAALSPAVQEIIAKFGTDIADGDIFITNDPYGGGGTHLCDVAIIMPVFVDGVRVAFIGNKAHWLDVGGKDPGSQTTDSTEIFQEGLQLPTVKLFDRGHLNRGVLDIIGSNSRLPDMVVSDMWSGVAACRVGERRVLDLCAKYGPGTVTQAMRLLLDEADVRTRAVLADLPKGTFRAEDLIDDDGLGNGPFPVQVRVEISDEAFVCDFTGSATQAVGPVNCTRAALEGAARVIYLVLTNPSSPANDGVFRSLRTVCPAGTVFSAQRPAPVSMYWESMLFVVDLVWKALAPCLPDSLPAGHYLSVCATTLAGRDETSGDWFVLNEPEAGGWGAGRGMDGQRGLFCIADGETYSVPAEVIENRYPLRLTRYELHTEDGGAGRWRGGNGVIREFEVLGDEVVLTAILGRHKYPPWGLDGGDPGSCNRIELVEPDGSTVVRGKTARLPVAKGARVRVVTGTGGGFGNPADRPAEEVINDVLDGYVTIEQASERYGVELDQASLELHRRSS